MSVLLLPAAPPTSITTRPLFIALDSAYLLTLPILLDLGVIVLTHLRALWGR